MLNIMRADFYRIFRGKGVYITIVVFLTIIILQVMSNAATSIGVNINSIQNPDEYSVVVNEDGSETYIYGVPEREIMTGKVAPFVMAENTDNIIYFMLPFIVFIAAADFSNGTIKNTISGGISRIKYFFSKLIMTLITCIVLMFLYILIPIIFAAVKNGFGGNFDMQFIIDILKVYMPQLYLIFAFSSIGIFLAFVSKKTAILNTVYIALSIVPVLLVLILSSFNEWFLKLMNYDIVSNIKMFAYPNGEIPPDLGKALIIGTVYILASTISGILIFKKSEIK